MKCLSLWDPWATLMMIGAKKIETRSWSTDYRGWVAIHAGLNFPSEARRAWCGGGPIRRELLLHGRGDPMMSRCPGIIAVGWLQECGQIMSEDCSPMATNWSAGAVYPPSAPELHYGDYTPGRFAWIFRDVQRLAVPVPYRGRQKLFNIPDDLLAGKWRAV